MNKNLLLKIKKKFKKIFKKMSIFIIYYLYYFIYLWYFCIPVLHLWDLNESIAVYLSFIPDSF